MEKDILSQINEKLSDVPRGSYLYIRHPLGTSGELKQFCDANYVGTLTLEKTCARGECSLKTTEPKMVGD